MKTWQTNRRRTILDAGKFLRVEAHDVELPDGTIIGDWPWIITPDYVNVVALTEGGEFLCFRQTKYAVQGTTLAIVGGYLDPGEDPLVAAQRELLEETGHTAERWTNLGSYAVDGNRGAGTAHLYLAEGARRVQPVDADDLEEQEMLVLRRSEVEQALVEGAFRVLAWSTALALSLLHLDRRGNERKEKRT